MATRKMTKKGALQVSQAMDRLASLFQQDHAVMGVSPRIAEDFALRLDQMSDLVEKNAGVVRAEWSQTLSTQPSNPETDGFNPLEVGKKAPGALVHDEDEPYVRDNFTQQESSELSDKQLTGQLPHADVLPVQDMMGKLADGKIARGFLLKGKAPYVWNIMQIVSLGKGRGGVGDRFRAAGTFYVSGMLVEKCVVSYDILEKKRIADVEIRFLSTGQALDILTGILGNVITTHQDQLVALGNRHRDDANFAAIVGRR